MNKKAQLTKRVAASGKLTTIIESQDLPNCPAQLDDIARFVWGTLGKRMHEIGIVHDIDAFSLASYCSCVSRFLRSELALKESGETFIDAAGVPRMSPLVDVSLKAQKQMAAWSQRFGFTAKDRASMGEMIAAIAQSRMQADGTDEGKPKW